MPKQTKKSKIPLFDVRVRSTEGDTVLLKGPPSDASPVVFAGVVAISVLEPFNIKKLDLKLYATLNLHWEEKLYNGKGHTFVRPFNFSKIVHCYEWDPIDLQGFLHTNDPLNASFISPQHTNTDASLASGFMSGKQTRSNPGSATSLKNLSANNLKEMTSQLKLNKSSGNLKSHHILGFGGGGGAHSIRDPISSDVVLQPGNYEFPFYTVLDGSIPESIIGHGQCTLDYKLQATIERGRFTNPIITRRSINVIRTLTADNPELSETVAVDNTWPGKVDYSISCPTKAIPIGSSMRVDIDLMPLKKGLRLGSIKIKLAEYSSFSTFNGNFTSEFILTTKSISKVTTDVEGNDVWSDQRQCDLEGVFYRSHNTVLREDKWEIRTFLNLPASLIQVTQDCDIGSLIKIRHKLKFSIGLINPDGHTSELRATLPITIFISPFIPVKVKKLTDFNDQFTNGNFEDVSMVPKGDAILFKLDDETSRFARSRRQSVTDDNEGDDVPIANTDTQSLLAPPNYNDRFYDKIYDPIVDKEEQAPHIDAPSSSSALNREASGEVEIPIPQPSVKIHWKDQPKPVKKSNTATFNFAEDEDDDDDEDEDEDEDDEEANVTRNSVISGPAFDKGANMPISRMGSHSNLASNFPSVPPVQHLSRAGSMLNTPSAVHLGASGYFNMSVGSANTTAAISVLDPPDYDEALYGDASPGDMTPSYSDTMEGTDLRMNLDALDTRLNKLHLSRLSNENYGLNVGGGESVLTPPRLSRNTSNNHLPIPPLSRAASSNSIHNYSKVKSYKPLLSPPRAATLEQGHIYPNHHSNHSLGAEAPAGGKTTFSIPSPIRSLTSSPSQSRRGSNTHDEHKRKSGFFSGIFKK